MGITPQPQIHSTVKRRDRWGNNTFPSRTERRAHYYMGPAVPGAGGSHVVNTCRPLVWPWAQNRKTHPLGQSNVLTTGLGQKGDTHSRIRTGSSRLNKGHEVAKEPGLEIYWLQTCRWCLRERTVIWGESPVAFQTRKNVLEGDWLGELRWTLGLLDRARCFCCARSREQFLLEELDPHYSKSNKTVIPLGFTSTQPIVLHWDADFVVRRSKQTTVDAVPDGGVSNYPTPAKKYVKTKGLVSSQTLAFHIASLNIGYFLRICWPTWQGASCKKNWDEIQLGCGDFSREIGPYKHGFPTRAAESGA
ncbi:hypothetical protein BD779DRAFT_1470602 [Infundibulicybe gibba]|nr:hypothetical protein BD779DRAFT_1470602 [Infundibulicybe gibba]